MVGLECIEHAAVSMTKIAAYTVPIFGSRRVCTNSMGTTLHRMRKPPRLVTFDIDGTLIRSLGPAGNAAHHAAINAAVSSTFGIDAQVTDVSYAGSTDMSIIRDMCKLKGVTSERITSRMPAVLADAASRIEGFLEDKEGNELTVLPGVCTLLESLKSHGCSLALASGNIEKIAWAKLSVAGIDHYFPTGGFGSDAESRQDIVRKAIKRSGNFAYEDVVHVGDALADVSVTRQIGVDAVGVLTGHFTREQLESEKPLSVLDDLSDTDAFLTAVGFETT